MPPRRRLSRRLLWPAIALFGALGFAWFEDSRAPRKPAPQAAPVRLRDETRMEMRPAPPPPPAGPAAPGAPPPEPSGTEAAPGK